MDRYADRFAPYFAREVAAKAARSLKNGSEVEFRIRQPGASDGDASIETFTFTRESGRNAIRPTPAASPQVVFTLTPEAADRILADPSEEVGAIGVQIARLIIARDPARQVSVQLKAGFLTLFSRGYLGVVGAGGAAFASFLASRGLGGMGAIKAAIRKTVEPEGSRDVEPRGSREKE